MPQRRYRQPSAGHADDDTLPLNTQLTILTRQSTIVQMKHNVFSAEMNPKDLIAQGQRLGFTDIRVYDWDTGIGAYSTTIEDRPGLHHWLYELLPTGKSRVLLVSQEDRLFRDRWETQHNRFIELVAKHEGWVICGQRVYDFRRDMDCEQFRLACKYGKQYIEFHIKGRLHPARHRAALAGRHVGGPVPWGYVVDYDAHSPTHMHYIRYDPHAKLVVEHIFQRFLGMSDPSPAEIARAWRREGLIFPFFEEWVDGRRARWVDGHCRRDEQRGGYPLHRKQALHILTDVAYLGWRVRTGELARDEAGQPKLCHEPLVDADTFWWCYDRLYFERPEWAPARPGSAPTPITVVRPRRQYEDLPGTVRFLTPGKIRCVTHQRRYSPVMRRRNTVQLFCTSDERELSAGAFECPILPAVAVDTALCSAFVEQLTLDDRDVRQLAQLAQQRSSRTINDVGPLRREIEEQQGIIDRARRRALQVDDETLAAGFLHEMRQAQNRIRDLERELADAAAATSPSVPAWRIAERAVTLADRIRHTFVEWPRPAQERVLCLALAEAVIGRVNRYSVGLWMCWEGGAQSRHGILTPYGERLEWSDAERAALQQWYAVLSWDALRAMLPTRTPQSIMKYASRLGLSRSRAADAGPKTPPVVVAVPSSPNSMAEYGFPLDAARGPVTDSINDGTRSPAT